MLTIVEASTWFWHCFTAGRESCIEKKCTQRSPDMDGFRNCWEFYRDQDKLGRLLLKNESTWNADSTTFLWENVWWIGIDCIAHCCTMWGWACKISLVIFKIQEHQIWVQTTCINKPCKWFDVHAEVLPNVLCERLCLTGVGLAWWIVQAISVCYMT